MTVRDLAATVAQQGIRGLACAVGRGKGANLKELIDRGEPLPERFRMDSGRRAARTELIWPGKTNEVTTAVLPFQSIEQIDEPRAEADAGAFGTGDLFSAGGRQTGGWTNKLIWGDNKLVLSWLKGGPLQREIENAGGLMLVYIDPPFHVGADFGFQIDVGDGEAISACCCRAAGSSARHSSPTT